ncbi:LysM peptidoglycan-binding domain-containing protein [Lysinibacillus sp. NPDC093190]|uniref:LysM peptidoglycan-binding domain-containing protein n=1 Tax=Lysinibacillus sp. NPDC093190 TaxID=3390575 RepID=UPI003D03B771
MRIHIVQKGDTLWKIAKEYGVSFEDLKRLNAHLANPDYIVPGMEIILPEKIHKEPHREHHRETDWGMHREGGHREGHSEGHRESHKEGHKEHMHKEHMHKESPTKHVKEKEVQRPMPPPIIVPPPPMPEPQMIPIPYPMPMPMPQPAPVELSWNQQVVMPSVEQTVSPIQIQPQPQPVAQPEAPPPMPMPQPIFIMPQMPAVPHCASCHQPVHHHMWWPMPMQMPMQMEPQVEAYTMPEQPTSCEMPCEKVAGAEEFLESSTSPFFPMKPEFQPMPEMMPEMEQPCGCHAQPVMMPTWQMDPCFCPPPCPPPCPTPCPSHCHMPHSSVGPWMTPHFFPGGMTPYRW